jgi:peptidoglycan/LPS O-acetylase OafA/YrhL
VVFITVFILGLLFTSTSVGNYLTHFQTYFYLARCATLLAGITHNLPGVFEENPYPKTVNGSLWTMPYEIWMYGILIVIWLGSRWKTKIHMYIFQSTLVVFAIFSALYVLAAHIYSLPIGNFPKLFSMFFSGAAFYVLRTHITLNTWLAGVLLISLIFAAENKQTFYVIYIMSIAYLLFYFAYVPSGYIRLYNKLGDYSYGIYIYAFPVQQSIAALIPSVTALQMVVYSTAITSVLAIGSWHLLEKRALRHKTYLLNRTRWVLSLSPWKSTSTSKQLK